MPSDSKKREQARKKEAQKNRGKKIPSVASTNDETNGTTNGTTTNGFTNGKAEPIELTEEGLFSVLFHVHRNSFI